MIRKILLRIVYLYQIAISKIGYKIFGIEYICRKLEIADSHMTYKFLKDYGATIGEFTNFKGGIIIDNASRDKDSTNDFRNLIIGNNCYIGRKIFLDLPSQIQIEDDAIISAGVSILTHADCGSRLMGKKYPRKTGLVKIGKGTWIGANSTILCNVVIGEKCVVAAGSVVTRSFSSNEIIGGVPAKKIGEISEKDFS